MSDGLWMACVWSRKCPHVLSGLPHVRERKKQNNFVVGTNNFKVEAVKDHESARSHQESLRIKTAKTGCIEESLLREASLYWRRLSWRCSYLFEMPTPSEKGEAFHRLCMDVWVSELTLLFTCFRNSNVALTMALFTKKNNFRVDRKKGLKIGETYSTQMTTMKESSYTT